MAYNPFNIFRRNQKALFAVLTVFVMIVFTLSSGVAGGDFFDVFARWLGARSGSKEVICKIDGTKITAGELDGGARSLQFRRVLANRYMVLAATQATSDLRDHANAQRSRLSETGQQMVDAAVEAIDGSVPLQFRNNPQMAMQYRMFRMQQADQLIGQLLASPIRPEDKEVAQTFKTLFALLQHLRGSSGDHYFHNAPSKTRRDLIEFMLWEKKADQLGIRFSKNDVVKLVQAEFYNVFKNDAKVRQSLQQTPGFTMDACWDALASEFKVRAAQYALLGHGSRFGGAPVFVSPYETFEYYRDQTSPAIYEVIKVPADGFVDRVTGEPSDGDIKDLWTKHADDEPDPRKERPGFKEPRKVSVAWFGVTGEEPYYKKLAEEQIQIGEVMAKASGALTVPLPGAIDAWALMAVAPLTLKEPAVAAAYNAHVFEFEAQRDNNYRRSALTPRSPFSSLAFEDPILPSSAVRPGVVAATVGAFVGQSAGLGNVGAAATLSMTAPLAYETRDRIKTGLPFVLGTIPGPGLFQTAVGGAAQYVANQPKALPIEALRPDLLKNTITKRAKALAYGERDFSFDRTATEKGDIERFNEELKKLSENDRPKNKAETERFIEKFLADRRITLRGQSTAPRDEWTIEDDPGLAKLVDAHKESVLRAQGAHGGIDPYLPFGPSFFWTTKFDMNTGARRVPATSLYQGEPFPPRDRSAEDGRPHYAYWRTEDVAPKKLNLITAKPAVVAAWKRMKARDLAKAKAEAIAEEIRKSPSSDPLLLLSALAQQHFALQLDIKDLKASQRATKFTINGVSPLTPVPGAQFGGGGGLMPFMLTESENVPFPTQEMETLLLENRDKPAKTVLVFPDAAKDAYYVATLMRRDMKMPGEFKFDVYSQMGRAREVLRAHYAEGVRKSRQSVVELLKKEFKYEETEEQKKKLDENVKSGGRADF